MWCFNVFQAKNTQNLGYHLMTTPAPPRVLPVLHDAVSLHQRSMFLPHPTPSLVHATYCVNVHNSNLCVTIADPTSSRSATCPHHMRTHVPSAGIFASKAVFQIDEGCPALTTGANVRKTMSEVRYFDKLNAFKC